MHPGTASPASERARNLGAVLRCVHRFGRLSRAQLAARTGIKSSAVGDLVTDLVERGLLLHGEPVGRGTPGRPAPTVEPRTEGVAVLAVQIDVASTAVAVAGLGGGLSHRRIRDRSPERRDPQATVDDVADLAHRAAGDLPRGRPLVAVGVSIPGIVRRGDGLVHMAPNLGWYDVPFGDALAEQLGLGIPVLVGSDGQLGVAAEHRHGAGVGVDDLVYLHGGVGVGGGIISSGVAFSGVAGYAGEIGHLVLNPKGTRCRCGGRGCLESEVGEWALLRRLGRTDQPEREAMTNLLADADSGDAEILAALAEVGGWLGRGVAGLVNVLNPGRVILGGYFADAHTHLVEAMRRELDLHAAWPNRSVVSIVTAALGGDSVLQGAAELALEPLLVDPTIVGG